MSTEYIIFEYLYRDASNYKVFGEALLEGRVSETVLASARSRLDAGIYFIPEQIGIPPLRHELYKYSNGPTEDDHCFHEFVDLRPASAKEVQELETWGSVSELLEALSRVVPNS